MDPQNVEHIQLLLDKDAELREKIKDQVTELDKRVRTMVGMLNRIHSTPTSSMPALMLAVRPILLSCSETTSALALLIPPNQYWRWKDMWSNSIRTAIFSAALLEYLDKGALLSLEGVTNILGMKEEWKDRITVAVEDYLHGLVTMVNELSRLAVNAVTLGNFEEPIRISLLVKEIFAGFTMLNLKNDLLRRRFDGLKYDIKKIEEVVYDVSLRKLAASTPSATPA